jgi:TfoX/Sxy family transcriptional regulator of competence genes
MTMSYYGVPADILEDVNELRPWVDLALEAARRAPAKKRKAKKPNSSME